MAPKSTFTSTWLTLRSGAPGLGGPFLHEAFAPLRYLDQLADDQPQIIVAIGDRQKTKFLESYLAVGPDHDASSDVRFAPMPLASACLIADCGLHTQPQPPRVKGGPQPGNSALHEIKNSTGDATRIAYGVYRQVLSPFAAVILVFVSDFGGLAGALDFLDSWARGSMLQPVPNRPTVILVDDKLHTLPAAKELRLRISTSLLRHLQMAEPTKPYARWDTDKIVRQCFQIQVLSGSLSPTCLRNALLNALQQATLERQRLRMDFSARHVKPLLRAALIHFAEQATAPFNIYQAARISNPIPTGLHDPLVRFLQCAAVAGIRDASFIAPVTASALLVDAYPPGLHDIRPPTAGIRILSLSGLRQDNIWDFLTAMRKIIHNISMPIWEYFDMIVAADFGL
ncbi:hypothetical protein DL771_009399 [Monosporascus sp. 5C6A]|nr:hypothetical protein DL771_009399 [Monosporascus sp. 5C6A]